MKREQSLKLTGIICYFLNMIAFQSTYLATPGGLIDDVFDFQNIRIVSFYILPSGFSNMTEIIYF